LFSLFAAWFPGGATLFQPYIRWPRSLTEPDLKIYRLFRQVHSLSADSRVGFGDNVFPGSVSRIVSPPRYTYLSTPSLHQRYPASSVLWVDPTTCTSSSNLVPSVPSTPFQRKTQVLPGSRKNPLNNMPWTMTPVEYPPSRL